MQGCREGARGEKAPVLGPQETWGAVHFPLPLGPHQSPVTQLCLALLHGAHRAMLNRSGTSDKACIAARTGAGWLASGAGGSFRLLCHGLPAVHAPLPQPAHL